MTKDRQRTGAVVNRTIESVCRCDFIFVAQFVQLDQHYFLQNDASEMIC